MMYGLARSEKQSCQRSLMDLWVFLRDAEQSTTAHQAIAWRKVQPDGTLQTADEAMSVKNCQTEPRRERKRANESEQFRGLR